MSLEGFQFENVQAAMSFIQDEIIKKHQRVTGSPTCQTSFFDIVTSCCDVM